VPGDDTLGPFSTAVWLAVEKRNRVCGARARRCEAGGSAPPSHRAHRAAPRPVACGATSAVENLVDRVLKSGGDAGMIALLGRAESWLAWPRRDANRSGGASRRWQHAL
jgi:hypothetical protein